MGARLWSGALSLCPKWAKNNDTKQLKNLAGYRVTAYDYDRCILFRRDNRTWFNIIFRCTMKRTITRIKVCRTIVHTCHVLERIGERMNKIAPYFFGVVAIYITAMIICGFVNM